MCIHMNSLLGSFRQHKTLIKDEQIEFSPGRLGHIYKLNWARQAFSSKMQDRRILGSLLCNGMIIAVEQLLQTWIANGSTVAPNFQAAGKMGTKHRAANF